jgi:hypothetical protein
VWRGDPPTAQESPAVTLALTAASNGVFEGDATITLQAGDWIVYYDGTTIIGAETYLQSVAVGGTGSVRSAGYLGDFNEDDIIYFFWYGEAGATGTIAAYKDAGDVQETTGIGGTRNFDGNTGVNLCSITLTANDAFYTRGSDYHIVLIGATIDGITITQTIAEFSINNRSDKFAFIRQP